MQLLNLLVILGSSREQRIADKILQWARPMLDSDTRFSLALFDPATEGFPMPINPANDAKRAALAREIDAADAFLVITPEYNRGYPAALKDVIDSAYTQWARKAVAFISYGGVSGGLRAVEQLRPVFAEVHAVSVRDSVSLSNPWDWLSTGRGADDARLTKSLGLMLDQLHWWASALRAARQMEAAQDTRGTAPHAAVTLINTFSVKPGQSEALLSLQVEETRRLSAAAHEAGWLGNRIYRSGGKGDKDRVTIVTSFESEEAKARGQRSDDFRDHLQRLESLNSLEAVDSRQLSLVASHGRVD